MIPLLKRFFSRTKGCEAYRHVFNVLVIVLCIFAAYGKSLNHNFVWDDYGLIVNNEQVKSLSPWYQVFYRSFWQLGENIADPSRSFYRPLITISYKTDYALWGLDPRGFHLTNILAHCICACVVYMLGILLLKSPTLALMGSIVWAIHPSHVENVCWVSGRTDIFCGVFFFLAFSFFRLWTENPRYQSRYLVVTAVCYLLALLSKEMALTLPLVILSWLLIERKSYPWRDLFFLFILLAIITVGYLMIRVHFLGKIAGPPVFGSQWERLASIPMVFCKYLGVLLALIPVDPHHSETFVSSVWSFQFFLFLCVSVGYLAGIWWCFRNRKIFIGFLLSWIPVTLLPVFYLGSFGDILYADRFLYIPCFGFVFGILAMAAQSAWKKVSQWRGVKIICGVLYGVLVATLLFITRENTSYWATNVSLFSRAAQTSPRSAYVYFNLGSSLAERKAYQDACSAYAKAVTLLPGYAEAYVNMGACLNQLGRYEDAVACFQEVMKLDVVSHILYSNLGDSYRKLGNLSRAQDFYRTSLALRSTGRVHNNLGECLLAAGSLDLAYKHLIRALKLSPSSGVYNNLGLFYLEKGQPGKALEYLNKAMSFPARRLPPDLEIAIHYNLAQAFHMTGDSFAASFHAGAALDLIPEDYKPSDPEKDMLIGLETMAESSSRRLQDH